MLTCCWGGVKSRWLFARRLSIMQRCSSSSSGSTRKKHSSTTYLLSLRLRMMRRTWLPRLRIVRSSAESVVKTTWTCFGHESGSHDRQSPASDGRKWSKPSMRIISALCRVSRPATFSSVAMKYSRRFLYAYTVSGLSTPYIYTQGDSDVICVIPIYLCQTASCSGRHDVGQGNVNPVSLISLSGASTKLFKTTNSILIK